MDKFLIGDKINDLVIKDIKYELNHPVYYLKCSCGQHIPMYEKELLNNPKNCGRCYSIAIRKPKGRPEMISDQYKIWRKKAFRRGNYKCAVCGSKVKLQAHHLDAWSWSLARRYDVTNSAILCKIHHDEIHHLFGYNTTEQNWNAYKIMKGIR